MISEPLIGHTGPVRSVACAILPGGDALIASACGDGTVRRWDAVSGGPIGQPLIGQTGSAWSVTCTTSPEGSALVVSGGDDGELKRWDATTGDPVGRPIAGHSGPVLALCTIPVEGAAPIIASAGDDRSLRLWSSHTGEALDQPIVSHRGKVQALASLTLPNGKVVVVSGGDDKTVRRWDALTGQPFGAPLTGHTDWVRAVTSTTLPDGRVIVISTGQDGAVRRWDALTGQPFGHPMLGHVEAERSLATMELHGATFVVSAGDDGALRTWEPSRGKPVGDPMAGHVGAIRCVTTVVLQEGQVLLVSGGEDGTIRRWNPATGDEIGKPLVGHTGRVRSVAPVYFPDGRILIVSAGSDGTLRRWDPETGDAVGDPLQGHYGAARAIVPVTLPDSRIVIVSGGSDWSLIFWPLLPTGQIAGEPSPPLGTRGLSATDDTDDSAFTDGLGRGVLAAHLEELLLQLTTKNKAGVAVIHIDGRWGSGKTRLMTLLERRLSMNRAGTEEYLREPVLVTYDAWRESAVAPEWWSLATAINRSIRRERSLTARVVMTVSSAVIRAMHSVPLLFAALALAVILVARARGVWQGSIEGLGTVLTVLASVAALGLGLGRVLFWSAPAFGRLYLRSDDNPLGEIAAIVSALRRWSPRRGRATALADTIFAIGFIATTTWAGAVLRATHPSWLSTSYLVHQPFVRAEPLLVAAVFATIAWGSYIGRNQAVDAVVGRPIGRLVRVIPWKLRKNVRRFRDRFMAARYWFPKFAAGLSRRIILRTRVRLVGPDGLVGGGIRLGSQFKTSVASVFAAITGYYLAGKVPSLLAREAVQRHPTAWALAPSLLLLASYITWTATRTPVPRRPLILVIDDLDRCTAERVVRLIETVHTLLREQPAIRYFRRWRSSAPFIVLVLGDGRWIRRSFEKVYETFDTLGSDVHSLGADFLQKTFDHVVLVPALSAEQVETYLDDVTELSHWAVTGRRTSSPEQRRLAGQGPALPGGVQESEVWSSLQPPTLATAPPGPMSPPQQSGGATPHSPDSVATSDSPNQTLEAERVISSSSPAEVLGPRTLQAIDQARPEDQQRLAEAAASKASSKEALAAFSEHLLARFASLMPDNPRLVKRVANIFGMLMVLRLHLGHKESDDYLARAAILFVRFPNLVDELLSAPEPPLIDPVQTSSDSPSKGERASAWFRGDVQDVLRDEQNSLLSIVRLARCYGREYCPPYRGPQASQPSPSEIRLPDDRGDRPVERQAHDATTEGDGGHRAI